MSAKSPLPGYLTKHELAEAFGKSPRWVERMVTKGLPVVRLGHLRLFRLAALEQWLAEHERAKNRASTRGAGLVESAAAGRHGQ